MNKRKIFLLILVLISGFLTGWSQNPLDTVKLKWLSFEEAGKLFQEKQKPIMIFIYDEKNDSCRYMFDSVFSLGEVANYLNILMYPVKLDVRSQESITFFDGQKYSHEKNKIYHSLVPKLLGDTMQLPSLLCFNKQAQGAVYPGFKNRDNLFPILIYYAENAGQSVTFDEFNKYYFKAYPPGRKQIMTRMLIKWLTPAEFKEKQKIAPKKVFIDFYHNYNVSSTIMRLTVYNHPVISKYLNENYYPVSVGAQDQDTIEFAGVKYINEKQPHGFHQFPIAALNGKMQFPAFVILDENLQLIDRIQVFLTAEQIEPILHFYYENAYKTMNYEQYKAKFVSSLPKN